jgi:hypothetical protein
VSQERRGCELMTRSCPEQLQHARLTVGRNAEKAVAYGAREDQPPSGPETAS